MTTAFILIMCFFSGFIGYEAGLEQAEQTKEIAILEYRLNELEYVFETQQSCP